MLLSIDNFKSIEHVVQVDISDLTVLAGANSSGKSSLIQALLLLKQTLNSSSSQMLNLNGPYVYANTLMDLMHNKKGGDMKFGLILSGNELKDTDIQLYAPHGTFVKHYHLSISFSVRANGPFQISEFKLILEFDNGQSLNLTLTKRPQRRVYDLDADGELSKDITLDSYSFVNFFPVFYKYKDIPSDLPVVKAARETLISVLDKVVYIAPLRVAPVLSRTYQTDVETRFVEPDGQNTRFILDKLVKDDKHTFDIVKEWVCDRFHLAKEISVVKESGKRYRVVVTTNEDVKVDLMHMGFGLSQILPIITQGCISQPDSLIIVEDPDVHMHPSIQAAMADFFIFICMQRNVSVLIETHSDHFVTRLRRRIAEKTITPDKVHLIFVEKEYGESDYQTIPLSPEGRLEGSMPPGFMDSMDKDFRAILEANRK
ncbi:MAG: AAA family ATPase [Muribaculaceae bacterium]|nr:AAA family ATPase [Muribaculaceae bacterium]